MKEEKLFQQIAESIKGLNPFRLRWIYEMSELLRRDAQEYNAMSMEEEEKARLIMDLIDVKDVKNLRILRVFTESMLRGAK